MKRPNILIFMTDQQNGATVLPGSPIKAITPVLDAVREDAVTFSRAYCPAPHCCPSRASFFSSLMPSEHNVWNNVGVVHAHSLGMRDSVRPWSLDLQEAGYGMHFVGKWHASNYQEPADYGWEAVHPKKMCPGAGLSPDEQKDLAYDRALTHLKNHASSTPGESRRRGEVRRPGMTPYVHYGGVEDPWLRNHFVDGDADNPFGDRTVTDAAGRRLDALLEADAPEPWCLFVGTLGPHDPYIPPPQFLDWYRDTKITLPETFDDPMLDKPALYRRTRNLFRDLTHEEHVEALRHYLAFCSYEDALFGDLIACLKRAGAYDETVIVFLSDHGDYAGDHGLWCKGLPAFLSAYHIPAVVKLPGNAIRGTTCDALVSLADFGPTFAELAGTSMPGEVTGTSLLPLLYGTGATSWRDALFFQTNGNETYGIQRSVMTDRWRFVFNAFDFDELYDLKEDPEQMRNLAEDPEHRPILEGMYRRIWDFALTHKDELLNDYILTAMADFGPAISDKLQQH